MFPCLNVHPIISLVNFPPTPYLLSPQNNPPTRTTHHTTPRSYTCPRTNPHADPDCTSNAPSSRKPSPVSSSSSNKLTSPSVHLIVMSSGLSYISSSQTSRTGHHPSQTQRKPSSSSPAQDSPHPKLQDTARDLMPRLFPSPPCALTRQKTQPLPLKTSSRISLPKPWRKIPLSQKIILDKLPFYIYIYIPCCSI